MADETIKLLDGGRELTFAISDLMRYHGFAFTGGVVHSFKVMQRALPILSPHGTPERREFSIRTAFQGAGARDGFEMMTRCFIEGRYLVDDDLVQAERGETLKRYVFVVSYRGKSVSLHLAEGIVRDEFIKLARNNSRTAEEQARMKSMQQDLTDRLIAMTCEDVYLIC